ncbi:MAG: radical SAM protein [Desulfobacterales bacterium]|nr:radical SAM protein [Desulfobacterales bacterium]
MNTQGVELPQLYQASQAFFETYGHRRLLGRRVGRLFKKCKPENRFRAIMRASGHRDNPRGFFKDLRRLLETIAASAPDDKPTNVRINGFKLPHVYVYHLMEMFWPGTESYNDPISVKSPALLSKLIPMPLDRQVGAVMEQYPVRLSHHALRQAMISAPVATQYLPFEGELDPCGHDMTFEGHFKNGVVEQMYQNRAIFLITMQCPVYCRFCFRKHKDLRQEECPGMDQIQDAVARVGADSRIQEVLITGGEPLYHRLNLAVSLQGLMTVDHVDVVRIATRSVSYYPQLFLDNGGELLEYLIEIHGEYRQMGKRLEIGLHFLHNHEVSIQSLEVISKLTHAGIRVYLQTPFLEGVNADGKSLRKLFSQLRRAGVEIYYIFTPCHPIHGTRRYWTDISQAVNAHLYLRAHLSDRAIPKLCTATSLGKIEWNSSGWIVEDDAEDNRNIWIRTPYTREYFDAFTPAGENLPHVRDNAEGTLDVKMMAQAGEAIAGLPLVLGNDASHSRARGLACPELPGTVALDNLLDFDNGFEALVPGWIDALEDQAMFRTHKTRLEIQVGETLPDFAYLETHPKITDVILHGVNPADPQALESWLEVLKAQEGIQAVRISAPNFWKEIDLWSWDWIDMILEWQDTSVASPFRVELETWWCRSEQVGEEQVRTASEWAATGIDIYANVPLLSGVNNHPHEMVKLARALRRGEMKFHHIYAAGLPCQDGINGENPITAPMVVDIASAVRQQCSGREIPLYIIRTSLGEVDFGLASTLFEQEGQWYVSLLPYDREYYKAMDIEFALPDSGIVDENGTICLPVTGMTG